MPYNTEIVSWPQITVTCVSPSPDLFDVMPIYTVRFRVGYFLFSQICSVGQLLVFACALVPPVIGR